jgi:hypothetical protein
MILPTLLLAAAGAVAPPDAAAAVLTCRLELPDGSKFQLKGRFDPNGFRSNLRDLIQVDGDFAPATEGIVITSDGTNSHLWRLDHEGTSQKFDASLTTYGSETAVLKVEKRTFVGRHWGRSLVGVGYCEIRRDQAGERNS